MKPDDSVILPDLSTIVRHPPRYLPKAARSAGQLPSQAPVTAGLEAGPASDLPTLPGSAGRGMIDLHAIWRQIPVLREIPMQQEAPSCQVLQQEAA